jgi:hypothetical protein
VLGVVELVQICRYSQLPPGLKGHRFANTDPANWCWVLANPRRLLRPVEAKGQARLFDAEVPDSYIPV